MTARAKWIPGPPPGRGHWWICWDGINGQRVFATHVRSAVINPYGRLLMTLDSGMTYEFEPNKKRITHHMPIVPPEAPGESGGSDA